MILLLVSLFPLAIYFLVLSSLNRRLRPLVVPGTWDFAGLLFGMSGLLLIVGPAILSNFNERWRLFWLTSQSPNEVSIEEGSLGWLFLGFVYFAVVAGGSAYLLTRRRRTLSIYNVESGAVEAVLVATLEGLYLPWNRTGNRYRVESNEPKAEPLRKPRAIEFTLEPFPLFFHAALQWEEGDESLRSAIEAGLKTCLATFYTRSNPAGTWFMGLSALLLFSNFLAVILLLLSMFLRR